MDWLEHRIPPPLVAIVSGQLMWLAVRPIAPLCNRLWLALLLVQAGVAVCLLGFATILLGGVVLGAALAVLGVAVFVLYIDRFQIRSEECALRELFGTKFDAFCGRVRRWV